jgi:hypothetical protein
MQRVSQERCAAELEVMILAFVAFERGGGAGHHAYFEVGPSLDPATDGVGGSAAKSCVGACGAATGIVATTALRLAQALKCS